MFKNVFTNCYVRARKDRTLHIGEMPLKLDSFAIIPIEDYNNFYEDNGKINEKKIAGETKTKEDFEKYISDLEDGMANRNITQCKEAISNLKYAIKLFVIPKSAT